MLKHKEKNNQCQAEKTKKANIIIGNNNSVVGYGNYIKGNGNSVVGNGNSIVGDKNSVVGNGNSIVGDENSVMSNGNSIVGNQNSIIEAVRDNNVVDAEKSKVAQNRYLISIKIIIRVISTWAIGNLCWNILCYLFFG